MFLQPLLLESTVEEAGILLHSLNRLYQDYTAAFWQVLKIWQYCSFHSRDSAELSTDLTLAIKEFRKQIRGPGDQVR